MPTTTTETCFVRGTTVTRLLGAIEAMLPGCVLQGTRPLGDPASGPVAAKGQRQIAIARKDNWFLIASDRTGEAPLWGRGLSAHLQRSVLTLVASSKHQRLVAERWKRGESCAKLELMEHAYRGKNGRARAPAKVLWPWLPKATRASILRAGIELSDHADAALVAPLEHTVPALLGVVGAPSTSPWRAKQSLVLVFTENTTRPR